MQKVVVPVISSMSPDRVIDPSTSQIAPKPFITHIEADVLATRHTEYTEDSSKNLKEYLVSFEVQVPCVVEGPLPNIAPPCMKHCTIWVPADLCSVPGKVA
jgi:hypothetical protein